MIVAYPGYLQLYICCYTDELVITEYIDKQSKLWLKGEDAPADIDIRSSHTVNPR